MRQAENISIELVCDLLQCSVVNGHTLSNNMSFRTLKDTPERIQLLFKSFILDLALWSGEECASALTSEDVYDSGFDPDEDYLVVNLQFKNLKLIENYTIFLDRSVYVPTRRDLLDLIDKEIAKLQKELQSQSTDLSERLHSQTSTNKDNIEEIVRLAQSIGYTFNSKEMLFIHNEDWPKIRFNLAKTSVSIQDRNTLYGFNVNEYDKVKHCIHYCLEHKYRKTSESQTLISNALLTIGE